MASIFFAFLLMFSPAGESEDELESLLKRFTDVYAAVEEHAAEPVTPEQTIYGGAIPGMLRRLDPHSIFLDPGQFDQLKGLQDSREKGFGTVVSLLPGRVVVLQTLPGTPSAKAGLSPGDEIVGINGYRIEMLDVDQLVGLLSQARQQAAYLDVRRPGNMRVLQFVMTPEELQSASVDRAYFLRDGVAYVRATSFDQTTGLEVREAIEKLGGKNLKGLVLDLRNNPGGVLPSALQAAALFLKPGQSILTARGRRIPETTESVPEGLQPYEFPLAVLVNGKTASAAEIVAGALQDHDRAVIIGEQSFGKGLVQAVYPLSEGTGVALTTSFYYTPSGRSIQKPLHGVTLQAGSAGSAKHEGQDFQTDSGRKVQGGGGITPDQVVYPETLTQFRSVLEATGSFTSFAVEYVRGYTVTEDFNLSPLILDRFQGFLSDRNIQPGLAEWSRERDWISNRLKTEIVTQALGVAKAEEVEAQRDPLIRAALNSLGFQ